MGASTDDRSASVGVLPGGRPLPLGYSFVLAVVLVAATAYGLLVEGAYTAPVGVRPTLPETLRGQDAVTLLAVVALVWGALRAHAGSLAGHVIWLSVCGYTAYTYLMYVVAPYNDALLLYIAAIGLATFGLFDGLVRLSPSAFGAAFARLPRRPLGVFLVVVAVLFATLWLTTILSVWPGGVPDDLIVYDVPSAVHVLDLAFMLPAVGASGILLWRGHGIAPVLAVLVLFHMLTLGLALLSMNAFVAASGGTVDPSEPVLWGAITAISAAWLVVIARRYRPASGAWLRPRIWEAVPHPQPGA